MDTVMMIRILLADDHEIFRHGLCGLIEKEPGMHVVGEAESGLTAIKLARKLSPHVIIMDVGMPGLNGIETTQRIKSEIPFIKVIALSMHHESRYIAAMIEAGASGYLVKNCALDDITLAIRAVMSNHVYLSPEVAHEIVKLSMEQPSSHRDFHSILSRREREVLQLLAEGKTARQTADLLNVSVKTVETHRRNVSQKLHIRTIAELTKYAIREGLVITAS
jgi:two-component system response regulator NreC